MMLVFQETGKLVFEVLARERPLAFPRGEGAPVRTLGRKRNGEIWDDICTKTGQIMSKYGALSRTAPEIFGYRRSSSVSLRSTASPRGKPWRFAQTLRQTPIYRSVQERGGVTRSLYSLSSLETRGNLRGWARFFYLGVEIRGKNCYNTLM